MSGTPMQSSVGFVDMEFQGGLVGMKKAGPRMEEKGEVVDGAIGWVLRRMVHWEELGLR